MSTMDVDADQLIGRSSSTSVNSSPDHKRQRIESFDFKDEDMWGVVYGCAENCVMVGLMNLKADEQIPRICSVAGPDGSTFDFTLHWAFAMVGSKLFATGGEPKYVYDVDDRDRFFPRKEYSREVYYCDLSSSNSDESLKFEVACRLGVPKISALVVPYKDKIIFIADPGKEPKSTKNPCEILRISNKGEFIVDRQNPPPFWKGDFASTKLMGHAVVKNRLYVRVSNETYVPSLYCLNMDTELWEDFECVVPSILKDVLTKREKRWLNYVDGDKLFELEWDEDPCVPSFKVVKLKKDDDDAAVDLKGVVECMGLRGRNVLDGWVLPYGEDLFCLMIWIQEGPLCVEYMRACTFKLGDDGSFDILTRAVDCGPFPMFSGHPFIGFTPAMNKVLNATEYVSKFERQEMKRLEAAHMKELAEACNTQFADHSFVGDHDNPYTWKVDMNRLWEDVEEEEEEEEEDDEEEEEYGDADVISHYLGISIHAS
ncbi:hypothetical protein LINGRAHAP2_LOCUS26863 [Linum grandiflorum]